MHKALRFGLKHIEFSRIINPYLDIKYKIPGRPHTYHQKRNYSDKPPPVHLICLKEWNVQMIHAVLQIAMNLKYQYPNTHGKKLDVLPESKVMILEDHNEPILHMVASKAVSFLGADDVHVATKIVWNQDHYAKIYAEMADVILVSTQTHESLRRWMGKSDVPMLSMKSRLHAWIQSLATVMSIIEDYGTLKNLNLAYIGTPHQVLNDYLILCPMLGANFKFKCCCDLCPVSPMLYHECKEMCKDLATNVEQVTETAQALWNVTVVIAGPTGKKKNIPKFVINVEDIQKSTNWNWTFYHTCPVVGYEVNEELFSHRNARTFNAFKNMHYIAAALIIFSIKCSECGYNPTQQ